MDNQDVEWAHFSTHPPSFLRKSRHGTQAQRRGRNYELKVLNWLSEAYKHRLVASPWIYYQTRSRLKWCQPDALLFWPEVGRIYILEVKLSHCRGAWRQLQELYYPVLRKMFPCELWTIETYEVCRYYDPHVSFPGPHKLVERLHPDGAANVAAGTVGVHIWKRQ